MCRELSTLFACEAKQIACKLGFDKIITMIGDYEDRLADELDVDRENKNDNEYLNVHDMHQQKMTLLQDIKEILTDLKVNNTRLPIVSQLNIQKDKKNNAEKNKQKNNKDKNNKKGSWSPFL